MTYPQTKTVCQLDAQGFYIGATTADLSPLEAEQGVYLLPANCVDAMPPERKDGYLAQWQDSEWQYIAISSPSGEITPEEPLSLEQQKSNLMYQLMTKTDQLKAQILAGYSQAEIDSFYRQEREAREWQANNQAPTPMLSQIAESRPEIPSLAVLVEKVIEKADAFSAMMGAIIGKKQAIETQIELAKSSEELTACEQEIEQWQIK